MEVHSLMMHLHFIFGVFLPACRDMACRVVSVRLDRMKREKDGIAEGNASG